MSRNVFSSSYKGRMFALFRHPVDRALSMYFYLATATWDPMHNPKLKDMTIEEYAHSDSIEHNWITRFLIDKTTGGLTKEDMLVAKEILRKKCLVGMYDDLEESLDRFARYFGWDADPTGHIEACQHACVESGDPRHRHPTLSEEEPEYQFILDQNRYDLELYEYAKVLYEAQGEQIFGVTISRN
eukprot:CAMPEP_0118676676 /NCGR_PEP_ID=MMETSP0800-20121206/2182_1 /TAXON_ID=210618 ORGANISM="Striatella unipunctata, Strain CCMP2910" /NCGR_SAMPLE_ID=MMETSP0800 /ASSEMBLY_ACC=CAM_ASM_000638 /LENGTH=184 /DNA_ID=CAMNT_0006572221 /DNA_START=45 /DNA_END=599 /DNA_ORIENTATION=-